MGLSSDLISAFVKATNDEKENKQETTVYATVVESDGRKYVRIDGASENTLTPVSATATANNGDRVTVMIKNHTAVITGNMSSPSATSGDVLEIGADVSKVTVKVNAASRDAEEANNNAQQAKNEATEALNTVGDASKTATNFISITEDSGVEIGNQSTGGWIGFRAQITNSAFNILDTAGNKLASYGEKLIELGKNATDAIIKLCGGKGTVQYITDDDSNTEYLEVTADKIRVKSNASDAMSSLYSMFTNESTRWEKSAVNVSPKMVDIYTSECIDAALPDKIESWRSAGINVTPTEIKIDGIMKDRFGALIGNGIAAYGGSSNPIDANTTNESLALTNVNGPTNDFWYIETVFYNNKSGNRAQKAIPYRVVGPTYHRYYYDGAWSVWTKDLCEGTDGIDLKSTSTIRFYGGNSANFVGVTNDRMVPSSNDTYYLGDSSRKWKAVYAVNGTVQTSDRNLKTDISDIDDRYVQLFDMLKPVSFRFSDPESDRVHIGYISQDVKEAMDLVGISDLEFAGYCRDATTECDEDGNTIFTYSLRYSEFIALNSKMIQLNRKKIAEQQSQIDELRAELDELKQLITK